MPIYEFVCESCAHEFEKIVSFSAATAPTCPACEGDNVKRRLSKPAIHFKGSGWYITDSKSDGKKSNGANGANTNGSEKSKEGEGVKSVSTDNNAGESAKTESVKSESTPKSTVTTDG
jgi:putative FmdB family regulatory protein